MASRRLFSITFLAIVLSLGCPWKHRSPSNTNSWNAGIVVVVPPGRKLVNATWKYGGLWVLTRPSDEGERSDSEWTLDEHSGWGVFNNRIILRETAK